MPVPILCSELEAEQQLRSEAQQQLQRRRQQHEAALHQVVTKHEACRASLHTTQQQLHKAEAAADMRMQQVLTLSSRGSELQQALAQAQHKLSTTAAAAEEAEQRAAYNGRELSTWQAKAALLQQELEVAQGAAEGIEQHAADISGQLSAWQAQAAVLQQQLTAAQGAAESSACQHSEQVRALQQQLKAAQEAAESAAHQHSEQEGQLRRRLEAASQSLADGQAQADFLRRQLAQAATVQGNLQQQYEVLQGRMDELGSALITAREQQTRQAAADAMQRHAVCQAERLVGQHGAERAHLAAELAHAREQAAAAQQQVGDRQAAFTDQMWAASQQHQLAEQGLQQQLSAQQAEVSQLSASLAVAQRQLSSLQQEHSATTQALQEELTARVAELAASLQSAQQASAGHEERACHLAREVDSQRAALADTCRAAQEVDSQRAALADAHRGAMELEQKVKAAEAARASAEAAFAGGDEAQPAAAVRRFHVVTSSKQPPAQPVPHGHVSRIRKAYESVRGHRRLTPGNGMNGQSPTQAGSACPNAGVQAGSLLHSSCSESSRMPGQTSRPCRACCSSWRVICSAPCASSQRGESWQSNWTSRSQ